MVQFEILWKPHACKSFYTALHAKLWRRVYYYFRAWQLQHPKLFHQWSPHTPLWLNPSLQQFYILREPNIWASKGIQYLNQISSEDVLRLLKIVILVSDPISSNGPCFSFRILYLTCLIYGVGDSRFWGMTPFGEISLYHLQGCSTYLYRRASTNS